ncbi:ATP-binding protein [Bacillaceae bacterium IKA-2]|nr:ATP-binding protein [Bacillaceae bacterium IKA-2]
MDRYYFFIYLLYGLVFIAMGIYASGKKEQVVAQNALVKSLKYLGAFGIIHGLSEWVTMVVITNMYQDEYVYLFYIKQLLKAVSFSFLLYFGISLLDKSGKYWLIVRMLPVFILAIWVTGLLALIAQYGLDYHLLHQKYNSVLVRYFMAFPASILTAWALYRQATMTNKKKLYDVQVKYKRLAAIFLIYGLVDGLIIKEMDFFPASVINNRMFFEWVGFPVQVLKIVIGVGIVYVLVQVINTFGLERKARMKKLEQQKIASEERKNLGMEVHDSIIQNMYAATLKIKYLHKKTTGDAYSAQIAETYQEVIVDLGDAIKKTREFISDSTIEQIQLKELKNRIMLLVESFDSNYGESIVVSLDDHDSLLDNELSTKESTNIFYIVQEAVSNSVKHSRGTFIKIEMESKSNALHIKIIDNGAGFSLDNVNPLIHFGFKAMSERAEQIGGTLNIRNRKSGTEVELLIPWR